MSGNGCLENPEPEWKACEPPTPGFGADSDAVAAMGPRGTATTIRQLYRPDTMRASSLAIVAGVALFVLPIPGTFVTGALVAGAGALARYLGH